MTRKEMSFSVVSQAEKKREEYNAAFERSPVKSTRTLLSWQEKAVDGVILDPHKFPQTFGVRCAYSLLSQSS